MLCDGIKRMEAHSYETPSNNNSSAVKSRKLAVTNVRLFRMLSLVEKLRNHSY